MINHYLQPGDLVRLPGVHTFAEITGTGEGDSLFGTANDDVIKGLGGDDNLFGSGGADQLIGASGSDFLSGSDGNDSLFGGKGDDFLKGAGNDDYMDGGAGLDRVSYLGAAQGVQVDLGAKGAQDTGWGVDTLVSIENLSGTEFADTFIGSDAANIFNPNGGDGDSMLGMGGDDLIALVFGGSGTLDGGDGDDSVQFSSNGAGGLAALHVDLNITTAQVTGAGLFTLVSIENVSGSDFDDSKDVIIGDDKGNILAGALSDDILSGSEGDDLLLGDGSVSIDWENGISGPSGVRYEGAGAGADTLNGGSGADTLVGGAMADQLDGSAGKDVFLYLDVLDSSTETGVDLIDGLSRKDKVDLSAVDADVTADGDQAFHIVNHFRGNAGELLRSYDAGADVTHFFMDVDGDLEADMVIDVAGDQHAFTGFVL